ncbi:hypothetical protein F5B17DRAFT_58437 [Nemania serpens]|nr:hypothetical protein F5B17DRAFT_58437 [Nemania serpens]
MDSKRPIEEEMPPPYYSVPSTQEDSLTSHLQAHLTSLPIRIRMNQEAYSVQQSLDDGSLLDLLLPEIDDFLAYLGNLTTTPKLSHLTLIPEAAVPPNAILSGMDESRKRGELCRVVRVSMKSSGVEKRSAAITNSESDSHFHSQRGRDGNSHDWSAGREFSDWGRFGDPSSAADGPSSRGEGMLWWRDEDMARRLARHLQPAAPRDEPVPLQTPVQAIVEERLPAQKEKKSWFWGKKRSGSSSTSAVAANTAVEMDSGKDDAAQGAAKDGRGRRSDGGAKMSVTAEEVAFRTENDFGIMESIRGWAVVVVVHVKT